METDPQKAPRMCVTGPQRERRFKKRWFRVTDIPERLRMDRNLTIYLCENCDHLHVGHEREEDAARRDVSVLHVYTSGSRWIHTYR